MSEEFQTLVDKRGKVLRSKSFAELFNLQVCPTEHVEIDGRAGTIDLIIEKEPAGSLRVVVQGFLDSKWFAWSGVKKVSLDGFRMDSDGRITPLGDKEFYEFD